MAKLLTFANHPDDRGCLTVIDKILPYDIKRVFYIYGVPENLERGRHGHKKNRVTLIAVCGNCQIEVRNHDGIQLFDLNRPDQGLLLNPEDWHEMRNFKNNCVLLALASEHYEATDYVYEPVV